MSALLQQQLTGCPSCCSTTPPGGCTEADNPYPDCATSYVVTITMRSGQSRSCVVRRDDPCSLVWQGGTECSRLFVNHGEKMSADVYREVHGYWICRVSIYSEGITGGQESDPRSDIKCWSCGGNAPDYAAAVYPIRTTGCPPGQYGSGIPNPCDDTGMTGPYCFLCDAVVTVS